jgi:choice-of-anchor B domain-containing protein
MNKFLLTLLILSSTLAVAQTPCSGGFAGSYPCNGIDLQSYLSLSQLGASSGNDSWGWTDPLDGKEYAIVGLNNSTFFIDITNPTSPRRLGRLMTHSGSSAWRDVKTYNNHAFIVSEANSHGMQVFDLTRLRGLSTDPNRTFTEDGHYGGFGSAHNIVINEETAVAYVVGTSRSGASKGGPWFIDISTPSNPTLIDTYDGELYTHDAQVVTYDGPDQDYQGREIFIGSNEDEIVILDVTDKSNVVKISDITYPNFHYTHQGWFTHDKSYFIMGDEEDEVMDGVNTKTVIFDLIDLDNPSIHFNYFGPNAAIDHNGYVKGDRFYMASYRAGLRIKDITNIAGQTMTEVKYFDTWPASNSAQFDGAWNVYPYFKSGNMIISNYNTGFFVVKDPSYDATPPTVVCQNISVNLDATGNVTITPAQVDGGSTDNVGIFDMHLDKTQFTCSDIGPQTVTLTVHDGNENESTCTATVTVVAPTTSYLGGGTWSSGAPTIGSNAKISSDYDTSIGGNGSFEACSCEVDGGSTLTVAGGDHIKITNDITVNGNLVVQHEGSVVQVDKTATVTNNGSINVLQSTPNLASRDFMIMGSPMTGETRGSVWNSAFLVLDANTLNFVPHPDVEAQFPGAENFADDNNDFWSAYGAGGSVTPGEGYLVRPQAGYGQPGGVFNYTYDDGTLNNGDVTFNVTYNTPGPTSADNKNASPNVLANPYPSAIYANDFINANAMVDEVFFWEHLTPPSNGLPGAGVMNFSMEDISMYNLSGGVGAGNPEVIATRPNGYISTGQGFGIKATAAGTAIFTNDMRRTNNNNTLRNQNNKDRVWLQVENSQYDMGGATLIAFNENATPGIDPGYDSRRLATVVSLYSHLEDGSGQFGIQTREAFGTGVKVPVGFSTQLDASLEYKISLATIEGENLDEATVYLIDNYTGTITNLNNEAYAFNSDKGTFHNRFMLQFEGEGVLGPDENTLQNVVIYPNPTNGVVNIYSPDAYITNIEVFDIRGRRFFEHIYEEKNEHAAHLEVLETGIYFVTITTENGKITKKLIKK